jgi:hypothetical protein
LILGVPVQGWFDGDWDDGLAIVDASVEGTIPALVGLSVAEADDGRTRRCVMPGRSGR